MDTARILQIITNSTLLATRLLSNNEEDYITFPSGKHCVWLPEDRPVSTTVATISATHSKGDRLKYKLSGGNKDGVFTISQWTGTISVAAPLDYEAETEHRLVVSATTVAPMSTLEAHTVVHIGLEDINDNPPVFNNPKRVVILTVVEEDDRDLPLDLYTASATDIDFVDRGRLRYSISGDGVDEYSPEDAFFRIESTTGRLIQLRALDRDPPRGMPAWKLKVKVTDSQRHSFQKPNDCLGLQEHPGWNSLTTQMEVKILVKDINDNAPVFPGQPMIGHVQENGPIELSVATVEAWDADEASEGTNAQLTYSLEKNVIDEKSGAALFQIEPRTGLIKTALCCLDRETTPQYTVQVVATDGGGLKGTGTVIVHLSDVNDNPPELPWEEWRVQVNETFGQSMPADDTLLEITASDPDISNYFLFRIVESSGWGWDKFRIRTVGSTGELYAIKTLDYEDESQRKGFTFRVEVTDKGKGGFHDQRHVASAWVYVVLVDLNDNPPSFQSSNVDVTVREDVPLGTLIASFPSYDSDEGGTQAISYSVECMWKGLTIDDSGSVRLWKALDREGPFGDIVVANIIATDHGQPSLTSSATLTIYVTDVNDSPPQLLPQLTLKIREGVPPQRIATLSATDNDVWAMGHGPPFNFSLALTNSPEVLRKLSLSYNAALDNGRGGAEVWTRVPLDREEQKKLFLEVEVKDAGGLSAVSVVTVVVEDVNDNPMKPGEKIVHLWKIQGSNPEAPLGRVFVNDPDDWDIADKTFKWVSSPHSHFRLDPDTGVISASRALREGRYTLQFYVSDQVWGQKDVPANVTVLVRHLSLEGVAKAVPLTIRGIGPAEFTTGWTPKGGGGGLGSLISAIQRVLEKVSHSTEVISLYGNEEGDPFSCVWISVLQFDSGYMNSVKLAGLLGLKLKEIEKATLFSLSIQDNVPLLESLKMPKLDNYLHPTVASLASTSLPLMVVDGNSTALVTPRLRRGDMCHNKEPSVESCTPSLCLNGGRCVLTEKGSRCLCPAATFGTHCKLLSRSFDENGWVWVRPLASCDSVTVSVRVLPQAPNGLILYASTLSSEEASPVLLLHLMDFKINLVLDGPRGFLKLQTTLQIDAETWHSIRVRIDDEGVSVMVDFCSKGWDDSNGSCLVRAPWPEKGSGVLWPTTGPLQVGGVAQGSIVNFSALKDFFKPIGFKGCISHLNINSEYVDLGELSYSGGTGSHGCPEQDDACPDNCGAQGHCTGGIGERAYCQCTPGWMGPLCQTPTTGATFMPSSYAKIALSFSPNPLATSLQTRIRTRQTDGLLIQLTAQSAVLALKLRDGALCAILKATEDTVVCLSGVNVGDGEWHTVRASRQGVHLLIEVDDGDSWRSNSTESPRKPTELVVSKQDGVTIAGIPEFVGIDLVSVHDDLVNSCIDDVRVSGRQLPLPPASNGSNWGQVTTFHNVRTECHSVNNPCATASCSPPFKCHNSWEIPLCSCGTGRRFVASKCQDINECQYQPCLNGGICHNLSPGYSCSCATNYFGPYCQWPRIAQSTDYLKRPETIATILASVLLIIIIALIAFIRIWRARIARNLGLPRNRRHEKARESNVDTLSQNCKLKIESLEPLEIVFNPDAAGMCPVIRSEGNLDMQEKDSLVDMYPFVSPEPPFPFTDADSIRELSTRC